MLWSGFLVLPVLLCASDFPFPVAPEPEPEDNYNNHNQPLFFMGQDYSQSPFDHPFYRTAAPPLPQDLFKHFDQHLMPEDIFGEAPKSGPLFLNKIKINKKQLH